MEKEIIEFGIKCCEHVSKVTALTELENIRLISNAEWDVAGFIATQGNKIIITFQGSNSSIDWTKVNFKFWKKIIPYNNTNPKIKVHAGFISAYKSVRDEVLKLVSAYDKPEIWCFGHSLGAAMATLVALDVQYNFPGKTIKAVVSGSPRVGSKRFSESYNRRVPDTIRIVNGNDPVTRLPPPLFNYRHIGKYLHIGSKRHWWVFWKVDDHNLLKYKSNVLTGEQ